MQFSALIVTLLKQQYFDAVDALWEWGEEYLDVNRDELETDLLLEEEPGA